MFTDTAETHLYLLSVSRLSRAVPPSAALALLSAPEREAFGRIKVQCRRDEYLLGRCATKTLLARYLRIPVREVVIEPDARGKLHVAGPGAATALRFNLSHSADLLAIAVSAGEEVGVDVERADARLSAELEAIASRHFCAAESRALAHVDAEVRLNEFFRMWTLKEAVLKAIGAGLQLSLKAVDVAAAAARYLIPWQSGDARTIDIEARHWSEVAAGYHVAVARFGRLGAVKVFDRRQTLGEALLPAAAASVEASQPPPGMLAPMPPSGRAPG